MHSYPNTYAGVTVDESLGVADLYVTSVGPDLTALLQSAVPIPVHVHMVTRSFNALMSIKDQVVGDSSYWESQGTVLTGLWPSFENNTLMVGVDPYTSAIDAAITTRYGSGNVTVVAEPGAQDTADRFHDYAPWNGGDAIDSGTTGCTSGFGLHNLSEGYNRTTGTLLVTAGHCFPTNAYVTNNGTRIGQVGYKNWYYNYGYDYELIGMIGTYKSSQWIWETDSHVAYSSGYEDLLAVGTTVCHSGRTTNKQCGKITKTDLTDYCSSGSCKGLHFQEQVEVYNSSAPLVAKGDSGGPWFIAFTKSSTRYFDAAGITSQEGATYTCTLRGQSNTSCSHTAYYQEIDTPMYYDDIWLNFKTEVSP